jgi:hypothetical protein
MKIRLSFFAAGRAAPNNFDSRRNFSYSGVYQWETFDWMTEWPSYR